MKPLIRMPARPAGARQQGVALIVVLILLIVMSVLGVVIMRSSAMQERMSANLRDRSIAFQAAEGALRFAQDQVLAAGNWDTQIPVTGDCAGQSICLTGLDPVWSQVPAGNFDAVRLAGAAPEYWIEYLGTGAASITGGCEVAKSEDELPFECKSPMYRVTARSRAAGRADVVLQANIVYTYPPPTE